jgi:6-phosphogluconolactonase
MPAIVRQLADVEEVCRVAAEELVGLGRAAIDSRGRFTVALSGGSTPRRLFELLAGTPFRERLDWTQVEFFWGDERVVPPDHPDSNFRMANEAMLRRLEIAAARIHRIPGERTDRDAAAAEYQAEIARVFGVPAAGPPPAFDLVLLGMGPDGHTASLFPHTEALKEATRWVVPNYVPKLSAYRMTLTPVILNRAACVMFLVAGADKAEPLAEVLEGPADPDRLPSQRIHAEAGRMVWLIDRAAGSKLTHSAALRG